MSPYSHCAQANFVERSKLPVVHLSCKEFLGPTPAQEHIIDRVLECIGMNSESAKGLQGPSVNNSMSDGLQKGLPSLKRHLSTIYTRHQSKQIDDFSRRQTISQKQIHPSHCYFFPSSNSPPNTQKERSTHHSSSH